jgi:glycosyltransferase involved in cell wall biosynthesis
MPPARRLRVALVAYRDDPSAGGSLRVAETLAQFLPRDEVEAHLVFAYGAPGAVAERVGVPVHAIRASSSRDPRAWHRTRGWFRRMHFDVIHFVELVHWIALATYQLPAKRVLHFHGRPILQATSQLQRLLMTLHRLGVDGGLAISHGAKRGVVAAGWLPAARVHVVHNAVNLEYFRELPRKEHARKALGLPLDALLFGMVARLVEGNACLEIFELLRHLPERWHAVLVGDGPLRPVIADRARQLGVTHRVHLPGAVADVRPAYAALDVVVLLSRYQPFCLMLAEAMAAGVPVAGLQGAGEYTEPEYPLVTGENALFIRRHQPEDFTSIEPEENYARLARAVIDLVDDRDRRERQVDMARSWVTARFSGESQGRACLSAYRCILGGRPCG